MSRKTNKVSICLTNLYTIDNPLFHAFNSTATLILIEIQKLDHKQFGILANFDKLEKFNRFKISQTNVSSKSLLGLP